MNLYNLPLVRNWFVFVPHAFLQSIRDYPYIYLTLIPKLSFLCALIACNAINSLGCAAISYLHKLHLWLMLYTLCQYIMNLQWSTSDGFLTIFTFGIRILHIRIRIRVGGVNWRFTIWSYIVFWKENKNTTTQECIPVGCVPPAQWPSGGVCSGACLSGGCLPRGCLPRKGVSAQEGGVCPGGGCLPRRGYLTRGCLHWVSAGGMSAWGVFMWPIPSCIWCYLYAVPTPTECQHQCSWLYSGVWSCDSTACWDIPPPAHPCEQNDRQV